MNPSCKLFSAITYYRKAVQLVPDIEFRLADFQQVKKKRRGKINSLSFYGPMDYFNFRTAWQYLQKHTFFSGLNNKCLAL